MLTLPSELPKYGEDNTAEVKAAIERSGLSQDEYFDIIKILNNKTPENFELLKLTILKFIVEASSEDMKDVLAYEKLLLKSQKIFGIILV